LCAAQGLDFRAPLRPGAGIAAAHAAIRQRVAHLEEDRPPAPDIAAVRTLVHDGDLLANGATQRAMAGAPTDA
jgi:histidine ammonia-lyase